MELKINVNEIIIKDKNSDEEYLIRTVRSAKEMAELLDEMEREALQDRVSEIANYR